MDPQRATARQFAIGLLATALVVVLVCGLFNAIVDPYGLFRWVDKPGFNAIKPRAAQAGAAFKYRAIDFSLPRTLLLGNSRAEMGWDPEHLSAATFGPTTNAALPGQGLETMVAMANHAWTRSTPTILVIGLEFFDCLESSAAPVRVEPATSPWAVTGTGPRQQLERIAAFATESLSLDTTVDSMRTLLAQHDPHAPHLRRDGFQPARDYPRMQAIEGARKLFLQRDQENARMRMNGRARSIRYEDGEPSRCFAALDQLLTDAQIRGQAVYLATYPYHARLLELIVNAGLWPAYEEWKTLLTAQVVQHQRQGVAVRLWDFGAYHRYAVEPIPGPGQKEPVPSWYWESGHFRSDLGARMLDVMLGKRDAEGVFGIELTPIVIADQLEAVRASRAAFVASQPQVVAEIAGLARAACRPRKVAAIDTVGHSACTALQAHEMAPPDSTGPRPQ